MLTRSRRLSHNSSHAPCHQTGPACSANFYFRPIHSFREWFCGFLAGLKSDACFFHTSRQESSKAGQLSESGICPYSNTFPLLCRSVDLQLPELILVRIFDVIFLTASLLDQFPLLAYNGFSFLLFLCMLVFAKFVSSPLSSIEAERSFCPRWRSVHREISSSLFSSSQ